ncbi:Cationic peroxidase 1 [Hibiscus syriacus]|uniref:peroxidase n=1 Tax=Hibiscus syriacus TaxID=106335 RepID=A0A6A3CFN8_HIBSY|nr:Cationic peroxidase 1 [Hibiscus syriacus]
MKLRRTSLSINYTPKNHNTNPTQLQANLTLLLILKAHFLVYAFLWLGLAATAFSLPPKFYDKVCPQALPAIRKVVEAAVHRERRIGASLLRLHFHDCFVNGCDGSLLLDWTPAFVTKKNARGNLDSVRGFEVVDQRVKWI